MAESRKRNIPVKRGDQLFRKACAAWDRGKLEQAFELFLKAAKVGDKSSQSNLGYFYDTGIYVSKNTKQALFWYRKAYRQGYFPAASNIATVYRDQGDSKRMVLWYKRAAALGDTDALFELGKRYQNGECVRKDLIKAKVFYQRILKHKYATEEDKTNARDRVKKILTSIKKHAMRSRT